MPLRKKKLTANSNESKEEKSNNDDNIRRRQSVQGAEYQVGKNDGKVHVFGVNRGRWIR
jgi:hypothetical protein